MYIQQGRGDLPFTLPSGYSGSAFSPPTPPIPPSPPIPPTPDEEDSAEPTAEAPTEGDGTAASEESAPTAEEGAESTPAGLFSKLPFLSSLLPPPRHRGEHREGLPEWALVALIFFLLGDSRENDLLPILLILLLWD